jgi:hypothetical protein
MNSYSEPVSFLEAPPCASLKEPMANPELISRSQVLLQYLIALDMVGGNEAHPEHR